MTSKGTIILLYLENGIMLLDTLFKKKNAFLKDQYPNSKD